MTQGRPDWSDVECMLALWVYHRMDRALMGHEPINKAALYREVATMTGRTKKAVEAKIQNVSACDPRPRSEKPIAVLSNKQERLQELFDLLWPDRRHELEDTYIMVRTLREHGAPLEVVERLPVLEVAATLEARSKPSAGSMVEEPPIFVEEGRLTLSEWERRSRSSTLTRKARDHYRAEAADGLLRCTVCGVTFDTIQSERDHAHSPSQPNCPG